MVLVALIAVSLGTTCLLRLQWRSAMPSLPCGVYLNGNAEARITLLMYADDRFMRKAGLYRATQTRILPLLIQHPEIKAAVALTERELFASELYAEFKDLYDQHFFKGAGYSFKPFFIRKHLDAIPDNEYILWHDCSPEIWPTNKSALDYSVLRLQPLLDLCDANGGILMPSWPDPTHTHRRYTQPACLELMGLEHLQHERQASASWVLVRKCKFAVDLVDEWLATAKQPACAATHNEKKIQDGGIHDFVQNRHDQSVLSLLFLKHNLKAASPCSNVEFDVKNIFCGTVPSRGHSRASPFGTLAKDCP